MRNIQVRSYQKGDEHLIEPVEEMSRLCRNHPDYQKKWDELVKPERTWTGLCDGIVLALGGVSSEGEVWVIVDKSATLHKIAIVRIVRQGFELVKNCNGFSELYSFIKKDVDSLEGIFARHLGFVVVDEMKFGDFTYLVYRYQK